MNARRHLFLAAALAVVATAPAWAHDEATLDAMKAPHGGQLRAAGVHHYELVLAAPGTQGAMLPVVVYVTDHAGQPVPVQGASATATLLSGGRKATVALQPAGDNKLQGSGAYAPAPGLKAIVSVSLPGQPAGQARFEPFAGREGGHAGH